MAFIIPSDISQLALSSAHKGELKTLSYLKSKLPNDYTVFHGVHWTKEYESNSRFGEIDFVIINQSGDVLFIEQKDGELDETPAGLVKKYANSEKNVVEQIHRSIDGVRDKFRWQHGNNIRLTVDNLIYCPGYDVKDINAVGINKNRVVDASASDKLAARIETILGAGTPAEEHRSRVFDFFCQTFNIVPSIHQHISSQEKAYIRQTGTLSSVLANLSMTPFRLRINGVAGSGKSHIARQFMARNQADGHKVLMLCFNRPLAERLKRNLDINGHVNTWYGFCTEFLKSRGEQLDYSAMKSSRSYWTDIQERVSAEEIPEEWLFDTLIIDEGQDFEDEWLEIIRLFISDDANILWLEDLDQNIYSKPQVALDNFVGYQSLINYRTPVSIARFIRNTLPFEFEFGNDLPGLGVGVHGYTKDIEQTKIVTGIVQDLTRNRGFTYDDVVVLTCHGVTNSIFSNMETIGGIRTRTYTGEYDDKGNQIQTDGDLVFDSIFRFKGKEAPAVILVDVDPAEDKLEIWLKRLYCGMTRATVRLEVVANKTNTTNKQLLTGLNA